jgi:enterochelin esterase-like enzyme
VFVVVFVIIVIAVGAGSDNYFWVANRRHAMRFQTGICRSVAVGIIVFAGVTASARQAGRGGAQGPQVVSPEILQDRRITFRILAPQAQAIRLTASDIPGVGQNTQLTKGENGVWEVTLGPIDPGAYRYNFNVDGVATIDPRSPFVSESNNNVWSLVYVPGADFMDTKNVPHGGVAAVSYYSTALGTFRRMHVYTPPGYERNSEKYPVFYLLHGAGDSDDSWTSVGRAGFIIDNLIAAKKAKPMIVVMPAGHTRRGAAAASAVGRTATEEFAKDFVTDVMPYIEKNYRVLTGRTHTAIAGLSMGGSQTLHISITHLDRFAYVGVYSSGLIGAFPELAGRRGAPPTPAPPSPAAPSSAAPAPAPTPTAPPALTAAEWVAANQKTLDNAGLKKGLKLLWFSTGKDDFLLTTTAGTVELLKKQGFEPVYKESPGGHTWINWRLYLQEFVPQLFN